MPKEILLCKSFKIVEAGAYKPEMLLFEEKNRRIDLQLFV